MPTPEAPFTGAEAPAISPLVLADKLLTLAQDAERAGFPGSAARMLKLAYSVWNEKPPGYLAATPRPH
jgi:hypothetical protein